MLKKVQKLLFKKKFGFDEWDGRTQKKVFAFAEEYKDFLTKNKTERKVVSWVKKRAERDGFIHLETINSSKSLKRVSKIYNINREKSIVLARFGKQSAQKGVRIILAHIDSPRLDLKPAPLYEKERLVFLKTHYYGGIKKYQWPSIPLALSGTIIKGNGEKVEIELGNKPTDPILMITDLLPHLSKKQLEKKLEEAVEAEDLNLIVGSKALAISEQERQKIASEGSISLAKLGVLALLEKEYQISEEDFVSADIEIVPAAEARDLGFDRSLVAGYGQDDRICAYTALAAFLEVKDPIVPTVLVLVDKEETGSEGATGATSNFIVDFIGEMLFLETGRSEENLLRDALSLSKAVSADVTVGFDPDYEEVFDPLNTARVGAGIAVEKYTGRGGKYATSEATAEYTGWFRRVLNQEKVLWQTGGLGKVDLGGGGTVAMFLARHNLDIIDAGPPLLSMHAPYEISSKADLWSCYQAYRAFYQAR